MTDENRERRKGYTDLEDRIDRRFHKRFRGMLLAFSIIGITSAIALAGFGILLQDQKDTADRLAILVKQNEEFSIEIQTQRQAAVLRSCQETNDRNRDTSARLNAAAAKDIASRDTEAEKNEVRRRRDVTLGLIDALVPLRDCQQIVKEAVQEPPPVKKEP
jgi:hypothetical protein